MWVYKEPLEVNRATWSHVLPDMVASLSISINHESKSSELLPSQVLALVK